MCPRRLWTTLLVVCHVSLLQSVWRPLFAQTSADTVSSTTKPPDELLIPLTEAKTGSRPIPGLEGAGYQYRYDPTGLLIGRLKQFEIERKVPNQSDRNLDFEWRTTSNVEDGDLYPFLGQVYRWSGKTTTLVRTPNHPQTPLEPDPNAEVAVFWKLHLKIPSNPVSRVNLEIKEFEGTETTADRVKIQLTLDATQKIKRPDKSIGKFSETISMKAGDHIGSQEWDLKLKRIVSPDLKDRNPGWAEFIIVPLARAKK